MVPAISGLHWKSLGVALIILAAVLVLGIGTYLNKAKAAASSVMVHNSSISIVNSEIDAAL